MSLIHARRLIPLLAMCIVFLVASCGDDSPSSSLWEEVPLVDAPSEGAFYSLAFSGMRGLAAGYGHDGSQSTGYLVSRMSDGTWSPDTGIPLPSVSVLAAVGFTPSGEAVLAGVDYGPVPTGFVLDQRGGWSRHDFAFGGLAFASTPAILRVAGVSGTSSAVILKSSLPDVWSPEVLPFPSPGGNERGLNDVTASNGVFFVCGFDDAGDGNAVSPNSVLFRSDGDGWERIEAPCGGCSNREFRSVAAKPAGGVFLGGAITDFSSGATDDYRAFLLSWSPSGGWVEVVLPNPASLDRVNDILIAGNGDIYLACGVESTIIVRLPAGGSLERDGTIPGAVIRALAESSDGSIWAAGSVRASNTEAYRPAIWKR